MQFREAKKVDNSKQLLVVKTDGYKIVTKDESTVLATRYIRTCIGVLIEFDDKAILFHFYSYNTLTFLRFLNYYKSLRKDVKNIILFPGLETHAYNIDYLQREFDAEIVKTPFINFNESGFDLTDNNVEYPTCSIAYDFKGNKLYGYNKPITGRCLFDYDDEYINVDNIKRINELQSFTQNGKERLRWVGHMK